MTIARVKPGDWGTGEKLTSAQMNAVDANTASALDKRTGQTDTLASTVALSGTVNLAATGKVAAAASGASIEANHAGAKIKTLTGGRIELGDDDYPTLSSGHIGRTIVRTVPNDPSLVHQSTDNAAVSNLGIRSVADFTVLTTGIYYNTFVTVDTSQALTTTAAIWEISHLVPDGATITEVAVSLTGAGSHAGLPTRRPSLRVFYTESPSGFGSSTGAVLHSSGTNILDGSASTGAYQAAHAISATCNQNNVVDKMTRRYFVCLGNEGGTNGLVDLHFMPPVIRFTITDLRTH